MMRHLQAGLLIMMASLLYGCASISKSDYKHQSDAELTARVVTLTPAGTPIADVTKTIQMELRSEPRHYKAKEGGPRRWAKYDFQNTPGETDVVVIAILSSYGWAKNFFCMGSIVEGLWLFGHEGRLIEVIVRHGYDGM
jgi:hypothetical protein